MAGSSSPAVPLSRRADGVNELGWSCCADRAESESLMAGCWRRLSSSWRFSYLPLNDKQLRLPHPPKSWLGCPICLQPCARLTVTDAVKLNMLTCKASSRLHATFSSVDFCASLSDRPHFSSDEPAGSWHLERKNHFISFLFDQSFKTKQQRPVVLSPFIRLHGFSHKDSFQRAHFTLALIILKREWNWTTGGWCGEGEILRI